MKRRKTNILFWISLLILQAFPMLSIILDYFTKKRLGMLRHMVYLNGKWEGAYPIELIKWGVLAFLLLYILGLLFAFRKKAEKLLLFNVFVSMATGLFLVLANKEWSRAYYAMSLCLLFYVLSMGLWSCIYLKVKRNRTL